MWKREKHEKSTNLFKYGKFSTNHIFIDSCQMILWTKNRRPLENDSIRGKRMTFRERSSNYAEQKKNSHNHASALLYALIEKSIPFFFSWNRRKKPIQIDIDKLVCI